jgi:hypothetical protein
MANFPSIFLPDTVAQLNQRLDALSPDKQPSWGKMNAAQMMAHVNVQFLMSEGTFPSQPAPVRFMMRLLIKPMVVGSKPYKKNSPTAGVFKVAEAQDFEEQKQKLIQHLNQVLTRGEAYYNGLSSPAFGKMTAKEWDVLFYKHLDHHLQQFGV